MKRIITLAAAGAAIASLAFAEGVAPDDVTFDDYGAVSVSLSGALGDAANGQIIMTTRGKGNCIACHEVTALKEFPFHGEVGPMLDGVADRWSTQELRGIVADAKNTFPESVMPAFYRVSGFTRPGNAYTGKAAEGPLDPLLSAQEIEDVVAYLMTLTE